MDSKYTILGKDRMAYTQEANGPNGLTVPVLRPTRVNRTTQEASGYRLQGQFSTTEANGLSVQVLRPTRVNRTTQEANGYRQRGGGRWKAAIQQYLFRILLKIEFSA